MQCLNRRFRRHCEPPVAQNIKGVRIPEMPAQPPIFVLTRHRIELKPDHHAAQQAKTLNAAIGRMSDDKPCEK
jgi:hypothetical protein